MKNKTMRFESLPTFRTHIKKPNGEDSGFEAKPVTSKYEDAETETADTREEKLKKFRSKFDSEGLTDEEYAEYRSLCMFPFSQRGRELTKKFFLHTMNPEEKKEWFSLKNNNCPMSDDIIKLGEMTEQGDPNVKRIEMNDCGSLDFSVSDSRDKIIWTSSLAGCLAIAITIEYNDGSGTILLSHYQPMKINKNLERIAEQTPKIINTKVKTKKALVLVAEEYQQEPKSLRWRRLLQIEKLNAILRTIKRLIGDDASILVEPYVSSTQVGRERNHSLVVTKTPSGALRYQTWYDNEKPL